MGKMEKGVLIKKFPWEGGRILQNATIMAEQSSVGGVRGTLGDFVTTECIMFSLALFIGLGLDWKFPLRLVNLGVSTIRGLRCSSLSFSAFV